MAVLNLPAQRMHCVQHRWVCLLYLAQRQLEAARPCAVQQLRQKVGLLSARQVPLTIIRACRWQQTKLFMCPLCCKSSHPVGGSSAPVLAALCLVLARQVQAHIRGQVGAHLCCLLERARPPTLHQSLPLRPGQPLGLPLRPAQPCPPAGQTLCPAARASFCSLLRAAEQQLMPGLAGTKAARSAAALQASSMPAHHCYMHPRLAAFAALCSIGLRDDLVTPMHLFIAIDSSSQHSSADTET